MKRNDALANTTGGTQLMPYSHGKLIPLAYSLLSAGPAVEMTDDGYALLDVNALITGGREGWLSFIVTGDSMRADILPGYIVFCDSYAEPQNGDTVAVNINGENCIKIFERTERRLRLVPKNGDFPSREVTPDDSLHILGVVRRHLAMY